MVTTMNLSYALLIVGLAGVINQKHMAGAMIGVAIGNVILKVFPTA